MLTFLPPTTVCETEQAFEKQKAKFPFQEITAF